MSDQCTEPINASTRFCAVFGHPIRHSASPAMQNAGLAALGLNWRYLAFDVHPDHLRAAIKGARLMGFIGLNLTVPHKLPALEMMDAVEDQAKALGAVNTIVFESRNPAGKWTPLAGAEPAPAGEIRPRGFNTAFEWLRRSRADSPAAEVRSRGFNTDADALVQSLREAFEIETLRGVSVLLLGAGGAARTAALRLAREGVGALFLVNRTAERAAELARAIRQDSSEVAVTEGYPGQAVDLVINATSLGLKSADPLPIDPPWLQSHRPKFVYDMVYRPAETGLLRAAKDAGCRAANGAGMLLHQGARALELWTGRPAPVQAMRAALEKEIYG